MIDTIISSSVLILIILAIRFVFKGRINPMVQYGLWGLAALRLLAFNLLSIRPLESVLSVMNAVGSAEATIRGASSADRILAGQGGAAASDNTLPIMDSVHTGIMTGGRWISPPAAIDWQLVLMIIWAMGAIAILLWLTYVNRKFAKRIFENRKLLMNTELLPVYLAKELDSPCLMGYKGDKAIYVTSEVAHDKEKLRLTIAHELCHYRHHDLTWALVRGALLALYWFNPLVWLAAIMSKRDCELACDYSVMKSMGKEDRLAYGRTLVDLIRRSGHKSNVMQMATTMYGSANGIKERITLIAKNRKMKASTLIVVLLIAALAVGCTFTAGINNKEGVSDNDTEGVKDFASKWADAYSGRDAKTIFQLCESEELYFTIGEVAENGEYVMGMSSPWPWNNDYIIDILDPSHIDIYYNFRTSSPSVYVAKDTITIKKIDDEYKVAEISQKSFDTVESKADFVEAYKFGFPDFTEFAEAYQFQADNTEGRKAILENPAKTAIEQLNLAGAEVSGTYEDRNTDPPMFVVKYKWDDGEVIVKLIQPVFADESGAERQASVWVVVNEDPLQQKQSTAHIEQIGAFMETHSREVFSPYYELLDFVISNYQEEVVKGKVEAVFNYKIIHKNYDKDPDTVSYIKEAKDSGNPNYQQMHDEYLQPQEMNFHLKVLIDENDSMTLYSNISPKGIEWEETNMSDFILK
ncbi:hypothetical protein MASR2M70_17880 [Bacillota bacterium]